MNKQIKAPRNLKKKVLHSSSKLEKSSTRKKVKKKTKVKVKKTIKKKKKTVFSKKKKNKKKKRYHTGELILKKCTSGVINFRSGWEYVYALWLEQNPDVVSFSYESLKIQYISNFKTQKIRNYIPDFFVEYKSGKKELIEIKRDDRVLNSKVQKKYFFAVSWCTANNCTYKFVTGNEINYIKKILLVDPLNIFTKK